VTCLDVNGNGTTVMDKQQLDKLVGIIKDGSKDFMDRNAAVEI
jgi:hypothetical protein